MMIPQGTPGTLVQRISAHVSTVDSGWLGRIRPAERGLIDRYISAARLEAGGQELPAGYRVFAESMGRDCGGLFDSHKISSGLDEIVELYEEFERFQSDEIRPDLPIVAKYSTGTQISLELHRGEEPKVVETTDFDCAEFLSSSWEHLLLQATSLYVELRRFSRGFWFSRSELAGPPPADVLLRLDAICARERLTKSWLCDRRHYIAISEEASIFGELSLDGSFYLRVFAADDTRLGSLGDEVAVGTGAQRRGRLQVADGVLRG